ncbi:restriction endonuclease subunit S [Salmonella enterica subsp. enterica serovar Kentucky]|uniref:Restriction endonuclease subunit S n=30 Tax=Salmonella enterica TaxID=28901 RepID=A0A639RXH1_SALER|nr:restriction endonuclease subunit S [Salmonella enterica]EAB6784733.1 restriction endonuclease subunit S [Salmonella enterica subsp. enterica]EBK1666217.1 restriction endonuclease subunit S [Salmonella enterica subsp. enterica serovar Newport]EBL6041230.1 restriction endonuclease subunit S [Salmonella enterica subsp. enterica serovar Heidelberg]EBW0390871.1 restriction endonuclease subunit S [Salmonella enterica subsp. enterica serovar Enteritidis]EBW1468342.1 restriction endonuclease subuni
MSAGKLPEGWVDTQLGNIVDYGKATKRVLSDVNDDTWVLELEDIEKESSKLLSTIRASERPFKSTKNSFKRGDVLYGKLRPYLNKIIIAKEDGVCTTEIIPLCAEPSCCNKYIFYWLKSSTFQGYVNDVSYGVNMPRLGTADGLKAPLRLAPLAEQKIIAEKLDTLLAQIDSTKARLEQIPQILKRFRQAVLAAAVSGNLTAEWRMNNNSNIVEEEIEKVKNKLIAKKIIKKDLIYSKLDRKYPIPSDWLYVKLQSIATKITDGEHKTPKREPAGQLLISARNIQDGYLKLSDVDYVGDAEFQKLRNRCDPDSGDVLISCSGSIGRVCLVDENSKYVMVRSVALIKLMQDFVINKYMMYLLQSPLLQKEIEENSKSTAQANLFLGPIKNLGIPLPPVPEQAEIVRRVEQLFAYADTIEKQVNSALTRVNSLTQSILAKAFRGELTAQWRTENPSLISGENSAAALLEKIKAERAASGGKKTSRKKA